MQFRVLEKQRPSQAGLTPVMSRFNRRKSWSGAQFVSERSSVLVFLPGERRPARPGTVTPVVDSGVGHCMVSALRPREHGRARLSVRLLTVTFASPERAMSGEFNFLKAVSSRLRSFQSHTQRRYIWLVTRWWL